MLNKISYLAPVFRGLLFLFLLFILHYIYGVYVQTVVERYEFIIPNYFRKEFILMQTFLSNSFFMHFDITKVLMKNSCMLSTSGTFFVHKSPRKYTPLFR